MLLTMGSSPNHERGSVLFVELIVLTILLTVVGIAAFRYYEHKNAVSPAASPVPRTPRPASPSPTPGIDKHAVAVAAADKYCKTHPIGRDEIISRLVFKEITDREDGYCARYSSDGQFALLLGICIYPSDGKPAGPDGGWAIRFTGETGELLTSRRRASIRTRSRSMGFHRSLASSKS